MVAVGASLSTRHYLGRIQAQVNELTPKPTPSCSHKKKGRPAKRTIIVPKWSVRGTAPAGRAGLHERARLNINTHRQFLPQLDRMCQDGAHPGWALRDAQGVKPTGAAFATDPGTHVLQLLNRTSNLFVNPKWRAGPTQLLEAEGWMRFAMTWGAEDERGMGHDELRNLCVPVSIPPKLARKRRISRRRRHYCQVTADGYIRVYLGVDSTGRPVREYLHRLILLAFAMGQPVADTGQGDDNEVRHACCNTWCGNANHTEWATHARNQQTDPKTDQMNVNNVGRHFKTEREQQREAARLAQGASSDSSDSE